MKKYTFTIPTTTKTSNNNFYSGYTSDTNKLKSFLWDKAYDKYPWLSDSYEYAAPKKTKITYNFNLTNTYNNKHLVIKPKYNFDDFNDHVSFGDFYTLILGYGKKYNSSDYIDEYDFKIGDTPVRIYDDRIQIGYNFISNDTYTLLPRATKKTIYSIYLNVA